MVELETTPTSRESLGHFTGLSLVVMFGWGLSALCADWLMCAPRRYLDRSQGVQLDILLILFRLLYHLLVSVYYAIFAQL